MFGLFIFWALLLTSDIAVAQVVAEQAPDMFEETGIMKMISNYPGLLKLLAFLFALQIFFRGTAEALTRFADYTDTKWDNKVAAWMSEAAWILGVALGKIGYGTPKVVIEHIKDEAKAKPEEPK